MQLGFSTALRQTTSLTLSQQQSLRVLQMSGAELRDEAERLAAENPFLEVEGIDDVSPDSSRPEESDALPNSAPIDHLYDRWLGTSGDWDDPFEGVSLELCFAEHLRQQAGWLVLDEPVQTALLYLIDALDPHGLLPDSLDRLRADCPEADNPQDWERALSVLRTFEPTGVGAFNRAEMLLLQVKELLRQGEVSQKAADTFQRLTTDGLEALASLGDQTIDGDESLTQEFRHLLRLLRPNITSGYADEPVQYIRAELLIEVDSADALRITLLRGASPVLSLHTAAEEAARGDALLREQLQQAKQFLRAVEARNETLLRIVRFAATRQLAFLHEGLKGLAPLTQQEAAQALELADSTVSRAVAGKYFRCAQGTFELRTLFPGTAPEAASGKAAAMARIVALIAAEDPRRPLSDTKLTALLAAEGLELARRTVASYRTQAGIPSPSERRKR